LADRSRSSRPARLLIGRLARELGVARPVAEQLDAIARERLGPRRHAARLAAFALATGPARRAIPERARARAVAAYLDQALRDPGEMLFALGMNDTPVTTACGGLLRP
jgi:hypothetical protein